MEKQQSLYSPQQTYLINPDLSSQQLYDATSACLCKAEALAQTASATDFETYTPDTIGNYLWALSDLIHEAKFLLVKLGEKRGVVI